MRSNNMEELDSKSRDIADEATSVPIIVPNNANPTVTLRYYQDLVKSDLAATFTAWFDSYFGRSTDNGLAFTEISQAISEAALDYQIIHPEVFTTGEIIEFCERAICVDDFWCYDQHPKLIYSLFTIICAAHISAELIARETGDPSVKTQPELVNLVVALTRSAWAHREIFIDDGCSDAHHVGWARALRMRMLVHLPMMYALTLEDSDACEDYSRLLLHCWYHSPDLANADLIFSFVFRHFPDVNDRRPPLGPLLDDNDRLTDTEAEGASFFDPLKPAWDFTQRDIIDVYGLENFLRRVCITVKQPLLRDNYLFQFLGQINKWFLQPDVWPQAAATGFLAGLREAVERQALHGEDVYQWAMTSSFMLVAQFISALAPAANGAAYVIRDCAIVEVLARAARLATNLRSTMPQAASWEQRLAYDACLTSLKTFSGVVSAVNMRAGRNTLRKILRQSMRHEWYPTLLYMRDAQSQIMREDCAKLLSLVAAWKGFGELIGIDEEQAKKEHDQKVKRDARLCSWVECQYHDGQPPDPLMTCKGCGEVRYCSRSCQRRDWYEGKHKLRCRRLKDI